MLAVATSTGCLRVKLPEARIQSGQGQTGLTWSRAVEMALARHPDLRAARATVDSSAYARNAALGGYLPSADATMVRRRARSTSSVTTDSLAFDIEVSQPIFTGFGTTAAAIRAWREWEAARWAYIEESATVRQELRTAFSDLLRLYRLLAVNREIATRRRDNAT